MIRISVLMGIYNCAPTLVEALDSLYSQTYKDFKIILCDDGSTDNTYQVAEDYSKKHDNIILIKNDKNMKLAATLNHCLEYADTEYVARMDGDDISLPNRFEEEISFLDSHKDFDIVSCQMICFDENGDWGTVSNNEYPTKKDFIYRSPFCHAPCMMRTKSLKAIEGYTDKRYTVRGEDYNLWYKFYKAGYKGYNLQYPLYKMRDDLNASSRRKFSDRWYGTVNHLVALRGLKISPFYYFHAFRNIAVSFIPRPIYNILHKKKIQKLQQKR